MTGKRLLILADPYGRPSFAPRLRYLCQYLRQHGWTIEVYTERWHDIPFPHDYPIIELPFYRNRIDWAFKTIWTLCTGWKDRHFARLVEQHIQEKQFDALFCTTFSTFPLPAAQRVARHLQLPLFVDIRDLDEQVPGAQYLQHRNWWTLPFRSIYTHIQRYRRNRVLRTADIITTISPWHVDFIRPYNANVHLVYNGFSPEEFFFRPVSTPTFRIAYIGRLYEFQHTERIIQVVKELALPDVELIFHTPDKQPLPISAVGDEIRRSSIMLVFTSPDAHGMMTTKFYEALGCEKPVLCIPSDNGLLAETMSATQAGLASDDPDAIRAFILAHYQHWKEHGFTHQEVNNDEKRHFSRAFQAGQMEEHLLRTIHPGTNEVQGMVSIIIPIYNAAPYLRQCLDSVSAQTYTNWQAILVDDASTDSSIAIAEEFVSRDKRFSLLRQETNRGQAASRNRALDVAQGQYIAFLDADDWWDTDYLALHVKAIQGYDMVQSGYRRIKDGQTLLTKLPLHTWQFTVAWMRLYRRATFHSLRFTQGTFYEDVLWTVDVLLRKPRINRTNICSYNYRQTADSTTSTLHRQDYLYVQAALRCRSLHPVVLYTRIKLALFLHAHC